MSVPKINGIYQVEKITDITNVELYDLILTIEGDIENLILDNNRELKSSRLVIEKFYKESCFNQKITKDLFVIGFEEQVLLLNECMNEKKLQDIFTGGNLGDLVNEILSLVFFDFTNLILCKDEETLSIHKEFYLCNIHKEPIPYNSGIAISIEDIKKGRFPLKLLSRGGKLHKELFSKQLKKII